MAARIAAHKGARVIGVDRVPERIARAQARGIETVNMDEVDDVGEAIRDLTGGLGTDSVIDASAWKPTVHH